jgi:DMSO/TMAO reductase YedYZ heme-binding membrane subunit
MITVAASGPSLYWYLSRGTGAVALVLLTASVVVGILDSMRVAAPPRWPRFAIDALHRDLSLLVIVFLAAHILTSVLDSFAPIKLTDAIVPLAADYRPLWMGLGALSFDLLLAIVVTSLLRRRLGYSAWRAVHWLAYASWPVAVLHGLGTGTDTKVWWMLALTVLCLAAVLAAVMIRLSRAAIDRDELRAPAAAIAIATSLGLAIFTLAGPLQPGWARRAGTPPRLLAAAPAAAAAQAQTAAARTSSSLPGKFSATLSGTIKQTPEPGGAVVDLALRLGGGARGRLRIRIAGAPLQDGGLSMTGSQVVLSAAGLPSVMQGRIVSLAGERFLARVAGAGGSVLELRANLQIDGRAGAVTGSLAAQPAGSGGG